MSKTIRTTLAAFACACMAVSIATAAPTPYPITINSRAQTAPPIVVYEANEAPFRASFTDGSTASDLSGLVPFMAWATNATAAVVSTAEVSIVGLSTGLVDFTFSPASINYESGRYVYEIGVLSASGNPQVYRQGVFTIYDSPYSAGAGAVDWTTNVNWATVNWLNLPVWLTPSATNTLAQAVALSDSATQPADIADFVTADGATNAGFAAASTAMSTGTTYRADAAFALVDADGCERTIVYDGSEWSVRSVTDNTNQIYVVSTNSLYIAGPPVGTIFTWNGSDAWTNGTPFYSVVYEDNDTFFIAYNLNLSFPKWVLISSALETDWHNDNDDNFPVTLDNVYYSGSCVIDYVPVTNTVALVTDADLAAALLAYPTAPVVTNIVDAKIAEFVAEDDPLGDRAYADGLQESVVTGAVCTATSGHRYYWTTATNVLLTASLTGGDVVNYALLCNTATNEITAIGTAGWKWTGGSMTNSIGAGLGMTFGWACNPIDGLTNAYATAESGE